MVYSPAKTVAQYLAALSPDQKKELGVVRRVIRKNLPKGFRESFNWGMIAYEVPLSVAPDTYNGKPLLYAALAAQKNYLSLYLMCVYSSGADSKRFRAEFKASGKRLSMGKSCVRFRRAEDLPLELIGRTIAATSLKEFVKRCSRG